MTMKNLLIHALEMINKNIDFLNNYFLNDIEK